MGEEWPGGSGSFQTTLFANSAGASDASATPDPFGPRNRVQSAASNATIRMIATLIASVQRCGLARSQSFATGSPGARRHSPLSHFGKLFEHQGPREQDWYPPGSA